MANAEISGLNLLLPLVNPQGETEYVSPDEVDRRLQEGYRRPDPGPQSADPYLRLLEEDAARGYNPPTSIRPELPRPLNMRFDGGAPGGPEPFDWSRTVPELGGGIFRGEVFPRTERTPQGEDVIVGPGGPGPRHQPTLEEVGAAGVIPPRDPLATFRPALTETLPDGTVRLLPHVSQPFSSNERIFIEEFINTFQPQTLTGLDAVPRGAPNQVGDASSAPTYYQFYGELVREGDERLGPGERPYILLPDGSRVHEPPEGAAFQPSTGRVYAERPRRGGIGVGEALVRSLGAPFQDLERVGERLRLGLVVPDRQLFSEALNIQGLMMTGTTFGRTIGRGVRGAADEVTLGTTGAGDVPRAPPSADVPPTPRELPRELDPAGFHIQSLEVVRNRMPERMRAGEFRELLRREGVEPSEMRALGLDELIAGPAGAARTVRDRSLSELGRVANERGKALRRVEAHPENPVYRDSLAALDKELTELKNRARVDTVEAFNAERDHIRVARREVLRAEAEHKAVNRRIREARVNRVNDLTPLYAERARTLAELKEAQRGLNRAAAEGPEGRMLTAQEVADHIRANRPMLDVVTRKYPEGWQGPYGQHTAGVMRLRRGPELIDALSRGGVPSTIAEFILNQIRDSSPSHWPVAFSAAANRLNVPTGAIRDAVESVLGASVRDVIEMASSSRAAGHPRYRQAIPDKENPTMAEIAFTLPRPPVQFTSGHWIGVNNPMAHMQVSIQRVPRDISRHDKAINHLKTLSDRRLELANRIENELDLPHDQWVAIRTQLNKLDKQIERLESRVPEMGAGDHLIFLGNQFQSDWATHVAQGRPVPQGKGGSLVSSAMDWIIPTMEQFVDRGIASGLRRIAIPDGATVKYYNPTGSNVEGIYELVRRGLDKVLERRGITPVSRQDIQRIYPIDDSYGGNPRGYIGRWHVVELPENAPRGARLFSNPEEPAAGAAAFTLSNISRGPGYNPQLMHRRAEAGESLTRRIREAQPTRTEMQNWPRAERIEMLGPDDPHPGPVLGFHATGADFTTFDLSRSRDIGHHFGTREQATARLYGMPENARIFPAYLDVRNPITLPDLGHWSPGEVTTHIQNIARQRGGRYENIANHLYDVVFNGGLERRGQYVAIRDALTEMGYDSIRYQNIVEGKGWSYIVWTPGRVRSATDPTHQLYSNPAEPAAALAGIAAANGHRRREQN